MKAKTKKTSRILSLFLALLMMVSALPATVFAAPASDIPAAMLDNDYLDALAYTGYNVSGQKNDGTIFKKYGSSATAYDSNITYGLVKYGTETVSEPGTATGLAPDIAAFESSGLCCASYVSYVYYNYLPNIKGVDTSALPRPTYLRSASSYNNAANNWVASGLARRIPFTQSADGGTFSCSEEIPIGSLIVFDHIDTGDIAHVALYAGTYNGRHFVTHVGNDRGPEISTIEGMSKGTHPEAVVQVVVPQFVEEAGKIEIYKKDPGGKALSGAYFKATNTADGKEYFIGPTNSSGYAASKEDLPYGTYTVVETVFPTDYTSSGTSQWTVTLNSSNNGVAVINAVNELKKGNIEVYKSASEDGSNLAGAIFTVYNSSGTKVTTIGPTNARGYAKSPDISYGTYRVVETTFPKNYRAHGQTEWTVMIGSSNGGLVTIKASNELKEGYLEITKSDVESGENLSGAEFTVYDTNGNAIAVVGPTDENGYAKSGLIRYGSYTVRETKVPVNYQMGDMTEWSIRIDDDMPIVTLDITNARQYGSVRITKTSEDGLVEGMFFSLTGVSVYGDEVSMTAVTDENGIARFEDVPIGKDYVLAEENTPIRYVIPETQTVTVEWNQVSERSFSNILKKWRAEIFKLDAELADGGHGDVMPVSLLLDSDTIVDNLGSPYGDTQGDATLAGAVYGIFKGDVLIDTYTTDANGYILTDYYICGETYTLREISPSEGYLLDETVYYLDVSADNYTVELNTTYPDVYEQIIRGNIAIVKHSDSGDTQLETPEAGAEFTVYLKSAGSYDAAKDSERAYLVCDENGYAETPMLPYGVYTVHQVSGWEGNELLADFDVYIAEDGRTYRYLANNRTFSSYLKIIKTDAESGLSIPYSGAGFEIYRPDGSRVTMQYTYPKLTVIDTFYTNSEGYLITPETLEYGKGYYLVEVQAPYGYVLNSEPVYFDITSENAESEGSITVVSASRPNMPQKGVIQMIKTGEVFASVTESGGVYKPVYEIQGLAGAVYEIHAAEDIYTLDGVMHYEKGELVDTITTGSDGIARSKELYLGEYEIQEVTAPHGMVLNDKVQTVELKYAGQEISITQTDSNLYNERQKVLVNLKKSLEQDEQFGIGMGSELQNITFGLYAQTDITAADGSIIPAGGLLEILTLDENSQATCITDLPFGKYYLQERSTDAHYVLNEEKYAFEFTYSDQETSVVELTVNNGKSIQNNLKYGSVSGLKLDEDGNAIEGAMFGLFRDGETEYTAENALMIAASGQDGAFRFERVPVGTWIVREIKPATGFVLNEASYPVTITDDGQVIEITVTNRFIRGNVEGLKVDEDGSSIAGAVFGLFKDGETEFTEITALAVTQSDSEGKFRFENLRYGKWIIRELCPAAGYVLNEEPVEINIQIEGETVEIRIENRFIVGDILGHKVDEDGESIQGALFGLFDPEAEEFTEETAARLAESDTDGIFRFEDIRFGNWVVKELKPATGFVANEEIYEVSIQSDGEVIELEAVNRHVYGVAHTTKVDKDYPDHLLTGAVFEIYRDVDGDKAFDAAVDELVGRMMEYEPGLYEMDELRFGGYFLYEKQASDNYVKDDGYHYFEITYDGEIVEIENEAGVGFINNHMVGHLKIVKTSSDGRVEGFSFRVVGEDYDKVFTTDANGEIYIENLRTGKYTVTEVENGASAGYKHPDPVEVELVADETLTVKVHNDKITVEQPPKTGDDFNFMFWIGLMLLSAGTFTGLILYNRRKKKYCV